MPKVPRWWWMRFCPCCDGFSAWNERNEREKPIKSVCMLLIEDSYGSACARALCLLLCLSYTPPPIAHNAYTWWFDVWCISNKRIGLETENQKLVDEYASPALTESMLSSAFHVRNDCFPRTKPKISICLVFCRVFLLLWVQLSCGAPSTCTSFMRWKSNETQFMHHRARFFVCAFQCLQCDNFKERGTTKEQKINLILTAKSWLVGCNCIYMFPLFQFHCALL